MGRISIANLKKTAYYLRRNGLSGTYYAVRERMSAPYSDYTYLPPKKEELDAQRAKAADFSATFSIVVPAFRTGEVYLRELIESLRAQTYDKWELILADASEDDERRAVCDSYGDLRIKYVKLDENKGIADNTNAALPYVTGEFTGLLDHDDLLTEDALYRCAEKIEEGRKCGISYRFLYSDEDKCDGEAKRFYEPHFKEDFNFDLLLSNNYICHFTVLESTLMKELGFRREFDGAQDHDLVLRAAAKLRGKEEQIAHLPYILYHWRCHENSTAQNPQSKLYAYDAGKRAAQDCLQSMGIAARMEDTPHLGFHRARYERSLFEARSDIGAVGGLLLQKGRIAGGRLGSDGSVFYKDLPARFSGYMHRAVLPQDAYAVDLRLVKVRRECEELFAAAVGVPYKENAAGYFDAKTLPADADITALSLKLGKALSAAGYRVLWDPERKATLH